MILSFVYYWQYHKRAVLLQQLINDRIMISDFVPYSDNMYCYRTTVFFGVSHFHRLNYILVDQNALCLYIWKV